ncbi:MAG TPA: CmpA/NrtA family ABC transporter substrate-binding protein [Verrucomicrobiae bacterium]|jgi:ABC-type nitrate/sulfonate/bicarbonate transport system substrate-binding protein
MAKTYRGGRQIKNMMTDNPESGFEILAGHKPLRLGFLPLADCAPLVMARELGLFTRYGLEVQLCRDVSWSSIQDKIVNGALDAAHAPAAMSFATNLGFQTPQPVCTTGLVLNLEGTAITISHALRERGVRDAATLREEIRKIQGRRTLTFATVFPYSSQNFLLRQWLISGGIDPDRDVRIVMMPPIHLFPTLRLGCIDGYCVGEPWTSLAVQARVGWCVATSAELSPRHPEKVLLVRQGFAERRAGEHDLLIAALIEACAFCDQRENRRHISATLARPEYVNAPSDCLQACLVGPFDYGHRRVEPHPDFMIFSRFRANEPSPDKAAWILGHLHTMGLIRDLSVLQSQAVRSAFRADLYLRARGVMLSQAREIALEIDTYEKQHASN